MKSKKYQKMTTTELRGATKEFEREIVRGLSGRAMNAQERATWAKAKKAGRGRPVTGMGVQVISLSVEKGLLRKTDKLRAKVHKTRAQIVSEALKSYLSRVAL